LAVGDAPLHDDSRVPVVDVAALDRDPLVRAQPGLGGEDDERP
jgi:hypothetical protein